MEAVQLGPPREVPMNRLVPIHATTLQCSLPLLAALLLFPAQARERPAHEPLAFLVVDGHAVILNEEGRELQKRKLDFDARDGHALLNSKRRLVYFFAGDNIYSLSLETLDPKKVCTIPRPDNPCLAERLSDNLQSKEDFAFSNGGKGLCITLLDRNVNMMDTEVTVAVDLESGKVQAETTFQPGEGCAKKVAAKKPCEPDYSCGFPGNSSGLDEAKVQREGKNCSLILASGKRLAFKSDEGIDKEGACTIYADGASASGRYAAFSIMTGACDYIHRRLFVVDLKEGRFAPDADFRVVGESTIHWSNSVDALQVDDTLLLFSPKVKKIELNHSMLLLR